MLFQLNVANYMQISLDEMFNNKVFNFDLHLDSFFLTLKTLFGMITKTLIVKYSP